MRVHEDTDGKNNSIDVLWQDFMGSAKARGSMLLLVDMPKTLSETMEDQLADRAVPYWTPILPELLTEYSVGDDGRFDFARFAGTYRDEKGEMQDCEWYFDREMWKCIDKDDKTVDEGEHYLGECPLLIFTESGDFPCFGSFAPIADLSKRMFNLDSELDEILRSQTFSLLTMQVPEGSADEERLEAAKLVGETIGTNNLMMHTGSTPSFIAPESGPATIYLERIRDIRQQIAEIGLEVATINQQESGIAMQMRFHTINAELSNFSLRMEDLERRAWQLTTRWLNIDTEPEIMWPRDFNVADTEKELSILRDMQETAMSPDVLIEQQKKVVITQFAGMDMEEQEKLLSTLDNDRSAEL